MNDKLRDKYSALEGWLSIIINLVLFVLKFWAGFVSGSVAIIADAWHTLSDSVSSVVVLIGTKIAGKPADEKHPFGYGRAELIATMIVAILLLFVSVEFFKESLSRFMHKEQALFGNIAIIVSAISMIIKEIMAQFSIRLGKKINSNLIIADGKHHRSDALSSLIILIGIFLAKYVWWIDSLLGFIVSGFIFYSGYEIISENIIHILGTKPNKEIISKIEKICNSISNQKNTIHHIHFHDYVRHQEISFHIRLDSEMSLFDAHEIATKIEKEIKIKLNIDTTIHMEPLKSED